MSIDDLARAAATDARRTAAHRVDVTAGLTRLHRTRRTRNVSTAVGAVVGVLVLVIGGGGLLSHSQRTPVVPPATSVTPSATDDVCKDPSVTCLGNRMFRAALRVPVTMTLPINFQPGLRVYSEDSVEAYRSDVSTTGVTVLEDAVPVKDDGSWSADPSAGTTAQTMALWLSKRPFLTGAVVTPTTLDGRKAWRVSASVRAGATLRADKDGKPAGATFMQGPVTAGYTAVLTGEYTLLDVPGAGVTVIWNWTEYQDASALVDSRPFLEGLHFG